MLRWRHTRAVRMSACLVVLFIVALVASPLDGHSKQHSRRSLAQFNDVGNLSSFGVGGVPALFRNWWLPLFPTSCFSIGTTNPLYLTQCLAFSTSF
jgi:hypothetical protein